LRRYRESECSDKALVLVINVKAQDSGATAWNSVEARKLYARVRQAIGRNKIVSNLSHAVILLDWSFTPPGVRGGR
jgi:hypothetical protein